MNLSISELQPEDVFVVIAKLWDRSVKEAQVFGLTDKEQISSYILASASEYGFVLKAGEDPVAIFGASGHGHKYNSWFVATDRFAEIGKSATRFLRGFLRERIMGRPGVHLEMVSAVDHPDAERWFNTLGFSLIDKRGLFSHYEYLSEKQLTTSQE